MLLHAYISVSGPPHCCAAHKHAWSFRYLSAMLRAGPQAAQGQPRRGGAGGARRRGGAARSGEEDRVRRLAGRCPARLLRRAHCAAVQGACAGWADVRLHRSLRCHWESGIGRPAWPRGLTTAGASSAFAQFPPARGALSLTAAPLLGDGQRGLGHCVAQHEQQHHAPASPSQGRPDCCAGWVCHSGRPWRAAVATVSECWAGAVHRECGAA